MMTPSELRDFEFKGAGRNAYKADDVDAFFAQVAIDYEKMYRENAELVKRTSMLADRLEQFKQEETDIKQAVISAQKAADLIVKDAENSVADSKAEAEAILAAAKGEADIIKADAEKQAIADSDLLLSIARDKAESIINKAKEEAHGILIDANASASDTVGAATRTITSESIHYDMLKKEVSEFRASILAQYKSHIEMISKLPELAQEKADNLQNLAQEVVEDVYVGNDDEDDDAGEPVVKTTLPFDFFGDGGDIQFVENNEPEIEAVSVEEFAEKEKFQGSFSLNVDAISFDGDFNEDVSKEITAEISEADEEIAAQPDAVIAEEEVEPQLNDIENVVIEEDYEDIPITRGFNFDMSRIEGLNDKSSESEDVFDDEDDEDEDDEPKQKRGFFRRKK